MNSQQSRRQDDDLIFERLRNVWEQLDPVPADLTERSLVAIWMDDLDFELMLLQDTTADLAGARGGQTGTTGHTRATGQTSRTITFTGENVSVMVTITPLRRTHVRLDGWVAPLGGGQVHVRHSGGEDVAGEVDREGRFVLPEVPSGLAQIVYHPDDVLAPEALDHEGTDAGTAGRPARPVAAPPVRL